MMNYPMHLIAVQPALTTPFSFPALEESQSVTSGTNSEWLKLQQIVNADITLNVGNISEAWYAGLPFWGVALPVTVP